jgi:regulator of sigma E protease
MFLAIISINLAILNLLPIGALDGGQLLFTTIEAIIRREIPEIIRLGINIASWVLILSLTLYLSYKDILRIFTGR